MKLRLLPSSAAALLSLALAAPAGWAQATQVSPPAPASSGAASAAAPPPAAAPDPAELTAVKAVMSLARQPATTPAQMDAAVQSVLTKYPKTRFQELLYTVQMQVHFRAGDYAGTMESGENALRLDPKALAPMLMLATMIPQHVRPSDLDREQRLAQAEGYDRAALDYAEHFPPVVNGLKLTPEQIAAYQRLVRGSAHSSLGMIAADRGRDAVAAAEFQQAIANESPRNQARDFLRLGAAQDHAKQFTAALTSLDQAIKLAADQPSLAAAARAEKDQVRRDMGAPAPAPPRVPILSPAGLPTPGAPGSVPPAPPAPPRAPGA